MTPLARALVLGLACATGACLVSRPLPDLPQPEGVHETRRRFRPDGSLESERRVRVFPDGRVERDGPEREYHRDGVLAAERHFAHDQATGSWRTWFADGRPRSELDFGAPGSDELRPARFWHPDGSLAAEGATRGGVREGAWAYYSPEGWLARAGDYRAGLREGAWTFYRAEGRKEAEGRYEHGRRVGPWTLWDAEGVPRASATPPEGAEEPGSFPRATLKSPRRGP